LFLRLGWGIQDAENLDTGSVPCQGTASTGPQQPIQARRALQLAEELAVLKSHGFSHAEKQVIE